MGRGVPSLQMSARRAFSKRVRADMVRIVWQAYRTATRECEDRFAPPEAHDLIPHYRRAIIEQDIRAMGTRHKIVAEASTNKTRSHFHSRLLSGKIVLTESLTDSPESLARDAEFRNGYTPEYQLVLMPEDVDFSPPHPDDPIFAVLIHGPSTDNKSEPGYLQLRFVAKDSSGKAAYVGGRIDLLMEHGALIVQMRDRTENVEAPAARLRRGAAQRKTEQEA